MKTKLLIIALVCWIGAKGQDVIMPTDSTGHVTYTGIVEVKGRSAKQLYSTAKLWISDQFKSSKHVIDLDDPEGGKIVCKASIIVETLIKSVFTSKIVNAGLVNFKMSLYFKDQKYKYIITDFEHEGPCASMTIGNGGSLDFPEAAKGSEEMRRYGNWGNLKKDVNDRIMLAIESLRDQMKLSTKDENW